MKSQINRRRGFTLIEILVVISIITILLGILLPSLSAARVRATQTACANSLRQTGLAIRSYLDSSNDVFPYASFMPSVDPFPLTDQAIYIAEVLLPHAAGDPSVFECPADRGDIARPAPNEGKSYFASEKSSYEYRFRLGGETLEEVLKRFQSFTGVRMAENTFWLMRDYDNFHGIGGRPGARRYVYNDGHVSDFEN
ncbi:MAG: type II secretion system GspH family protein [Phycisphaerae bacterium]|nr:type II secretion system GspH family protein [Phycisphaerae bacterium]